MEKTMEKKTMETVRHVEAVVVAVLDAWNEGRTSRDIAWQFGLSRNSVIGLVHRNGKRLYPNGFKESSLDTFRKRISTGKKQSSAGMKPVKQPRPVSLAQVALVEKVEKPRNERVDKLRSNGDGRWGIVELAGFNKHDPTCKYYLGGGEYCTGHPVISRTGLRSPWCEEHYKECVKENQQEGRNFRRWI